MRKKIAIIAVVIMCFMPVFAQAVVLAPKNSTLPENRPLQPIPEFVAPNYEHSVSNPSGDVNSVNPESVAEAKVSVAEQTVAALNVKGKNWFLAVVAVLVGVVFVLVAFSLKKGRREDRQ